MKQGGPKSRTQEHLTENIVIQGLIPTRQSKTNFAIMTNDVQDSEHRLPENHGEAETNEGARCRCTGGKVMAGLMGNR